MKMIYISRLPRFVSRGIANAAIKKFGTVPAEKLNEKNEFDKHIEDLESLVTVYAKNRTKLPAREPFVKNFFLGKVDTEILSYPELDNKDLNDLEATSSILQKVSSHDKSEKIKDMLQRMKKLKCLGLECSLDIGGRELNQIEHCRFNEILLKSHHRYSLLNNELCIYIISKFGTDTQKNNYLQRLMNGDILSTISIANNSAESDENASDVLKATLTDKFNSYVLKGRKKHIINGAYADSIIIFVPDGDTARNSIAEDDFTAFIIDKNTPGISIEKMDINEPSLEGTCDIVFEDVELPKENILGLSGAGRDILSHVLPEYHLSMSVINLNIMKTLANSLAKDLLMNATPGEDIYQTEAITSVVSEILSNTYMVESMIYLTSGLMSTYENQDCDVEALITRVFSTELALKSTTLGLSLLGTASMDHKHFGQQLHREALTQYISYENENMAKLMVGLLGIQYSGRSLGDTVKKLRNPLFHGTFIMKKLWQNRRHESDNPNLTLELKNYFHPGCQEAANEIEYCILRLQYATETFLGKYGIDVLNCHNHLRRLSDSAMHIYAMVSCLSRASRSYCIGLEYNESEILTSQVICTNSFKQVRSNLNDVIEECLVVDEPMKTLSNNLYRHKNYYFAHPLAKNF